MKTSDLIRGIIYGSLVAFAIAVFSLTPIAHDLMVLLGVSQ